MCEIDFNWKETTKSMQHANRDESDLYGEWISVSTSSKVFKNIESENNSHSTFLDIWKCTSMNEIIWYLDKKIEKIGTCRRSICFITWTISDVVTALSSWQSEIWELYITSQNYTYTYLLMFDEIFGESERKKNIRYPFQNF